MPEYSQISRERLATCHPDIQRVFDVVIQKFDCTIICGHRGQASQNKAYKTGKSKVRWPDSKHNRTPSEAVDVAPHPINWKDRERFILLAGYVLGVAIKMNIPLRWGGDWNRNFVLSDEDFHDLAHFELITTIGST